MTRRWSSATETPSGSLETAIATTCWASTSSAFRGTTVGSIWPSCMRRATTAHSSRSPRNFGKIRPRLTSPTPCPARPIRCRPRATDLGDSICSTRSTAPMSIPSSSEEVATRQGSPPPFSSSSTLVRSSRASEPWWARAISSGAAAARRAPRRRPARLLLLAGQLVEPQRHPLGRAAVVDEDDRRGVFADEAQQLGVDGRPDRGAGRLAALHRVERVGRRVQRARPARSSTRPAPRSAGPAACGRRHRRSSPRGVARPGSARSPRAGSAWRSARSAGRPTPPARSTGCAARTSASRRSRVSARCEPRLEWATAWISSTITVSTPSSIERAWEVRIRYSDSGVVTRMSGGLRTIAARSRWGVSPVRIATVMCSAPMPRIGARRLRSMS